MYKLYDIIFLVCCRESPDFYPIHESRIARLLGPSCSCSFTCHLISAFSARTPACDGLIIWPQGGKTAVWGEPMAQSIWKKTRLLKIYVWFFWYIHKSNYTRNVCFRQVSRYCWVFSQHSPTKKSQHSPTKKNVTNQVCPVTLLEDIHWPGATDHETFNSPPRFPGQIKSPSNSSKLLRLQGHHRSNLATLKASKDQVIS